MIKTVNEQQKQLLKLRLQNYKRALKVLQDEKIMQAIEKFEGKFYNKRFLNMLNEIDNIFYIDEQNKKYGNIELSIRFYDIKDRSIDIDNYRLYIDTRIDYILYFENNNYMNCEQLKEQLKKKIEQLKIRIELFEKSLNDIENVVKKYNDLKQQFEDYIYNMSYDIKEFLELK